MQLFHNDYNEICHPEILRRMQQSSLEQMNGYGRDTHCENAAGIIRRLCADESLAVHFMMGGTQANLTVIDAALRPHQGVLGANSAHINGHETGAVEATGHKVLTIPSRNGKITACQIQAVVQSHLENDDREHEVQPKMVYLSNSTELGTTYSLRELEEISAVCKQYCLFLFVDGARLGYALASAGNDVTLPDLARLTDVFYIGGTKVGAMFGEAVVISNPVIAEDFRYLIKQHGGMLAKGWLLGLQFEVLLEDGLYFANARHANHMADRLRNALSRAGYPLYIEGETNQVFAVLPDKVLLELGKNFTFCKQARVDGEHQAVRFCTSWATRDESIEDLCREIQRLSQ